jgi:hypothetical protein
MILPDTINFVTSMQITTTASIIFGALGYYIGHRGFPGVKNDLNDIKKDVQKLKAKLK